MNRKKIGLAAASLLAAGAIVGGGSALTNAAQNATPSPSTSASSGATQGQGGGQGQGVQQHQHTTVTGSEAQKVIDAVKAKDSSVTISTVEKDPDGTYDAHGTKSDGTQVMFDVSADLKTVSAGRGGPGGGSQDAAVTGSEAQKVIDAVKAKDSSVTIDTVRKDPDGSYDALGSKSDGTKVMYDVSADLKTIAEGGQGKGGPGGPNGANANGGSGTASNGSSANSATPAS